MARQELHGHGDEIRDGRPEARDRGRELSQPRIPTMASRTAVVVVAVTALLFAAASAQEMDMGMPPAPAPVTGAAAGAAASALAVACSAVLSLLVAGGLAH
ncbi:hypothetical protein ZWY2020_022040 [Hordeum vulgare]|nr:hypothetical protein ZWY2020_022040 [Hordeum vulgare]